MADSGIRTRHLWLPKHPTSMYYKDTNDSAEQSARHGQNQEKEKIRTTELNVFISKDNFRQKIITSQQGTGVWSFKTMPFTFSKN